MMASNSSGVVADAIAQDVHPSLLTCLKPGSSRPRTISAMRSGSHAVSRKVNPLELEILPAPEPTCAATEAASYGLGDLLFELFDTPRVPLLPGAPCTDALDREAQILAVLADLIQGPVNPALSAKAWALARASCGVAPIPWRVNGFRDHTPTSSLSSHTLWATDSRAPVAARVVPALDVVEHGEADAAVDRQRGRRLRQRALRELLRDARARAPRPPARFRTQADARLAVFDVIEGWRFGFPLTVWVTPGRIACRARHLSGPIGLAAPRRPAPAAPSRTSLRSGR
jgi:hypothetical protein